MIKDKSQEYCENAARFLSSNERTELFEKLVTLLPISDSKPAPIRQAAKILGVSETIVYRWKRKADSPKDENTAKIIAEIIKRDAKFFDNLRGKLMDDILETYFFLINQKLSNYVAEEIRESAFGYIRPLLTLLFYKSRNLDMSQFRYSGWATPEIKREKYLSDLDYSIRVMDKLVSDAKATYYIDVR